MPRAKVNGVQLFYELSGTGAVPLLLVHGSWDSHQSERPSAAGSVREDVPDLAALLEHVGLAPAGVVANSFGASIALRLAAEHPELFRGLIAHKPPLFALLADDAALAPMLRDVEQKIRAVVERIAADDNACAAEQFVGTVALGPGAWADVPHELRQIFIENAPTFLDEANDPEQLVFDLEWINGFCKPTLLTVGDESPPAFAPIVARLAGVLPREQVVKIPGAEHVPHSTHADAYAEAIIAFTRRHAV